MTVVLIDDHPLLSLGLSQGLSALGLESVAVEPAPTDVLLEQLRNRASQAELVVLDYAMPAVADTVALVATLVHEGLRVIILSGSDDEIGLARCLKAGAEAVISKDESVDSIIDLIATATEGRCVRPNHKAVTLAELDLFNIDRAKSERVFAALSPSERGVLDLLMAGQSAAQIAGIRFVSVATIRTQIKSILTKLNANSQLQAVALAHQHGYVA